MSELETTVPGYLHLSENESKRLVSNAPVIMFHLDILPTRSITYINPAVERILGYAPQEFYLDKDLLERLIHPDDVSLTNPNTWEDLESSIPGIARWFHKNGETVWLEEYITPTRNRDGDIAAIEGIAIDITLRILAEQIAGESLEKYQSIVEASPSNITIVDREGTIQYVNRAANHSSVDEIVGSSAYSFLDEKNSEVVRRSIAQVFETKQPVEYEIGVRSVNREIFYHGRVAPLFEDGPLNSVVIFADDLTEMRYAYLLLEENQAKLKKIIDTSPNLVYIFDLEKNKNIYSNDRLQAILGYAPEEIQQMGDALIPSLLHPDDRESVLKNLSRFVDVKNGEILENEYRMRTKLGEWRWLLSRDTVFNRNQDGTVKQILGIVQDITERVQAEQALVKYTQNLEAIVDERSHALMETREQLIRQEKLALLGRLAGSVGHELRSPLGVITNAVYILNHKLAGANKDVLEYLQMIQEQIKKSDRIISDLLEFARVKSIDRINFDACTAIEEVINILTIPDDIAIQLEIQEQTLQPYMDRNHFGQIIENLLSNAVQALPESGMITIHGEDCGDAVRISIQDNGIGIPEGNLEKIFEPLYTTRPTGIGLGLAITRNYLEANGGLIDVESVPGEGSTFTLTLPKYGGHD